MRWPIITACVAIIFTVIPLISAGFLQIFETTLDVGEFKITKQVQLSEKSEKLSLRLEEIEKAMATDLGKFEDAAIATEIEKLNKRFKSVEEKTLALRQAINPLKPDEVLTIARLTDEINSLKKDMDESQQSIEKELQSFQDSILREAKSINNSTNLILVVLIPLVINFLYTVWRDFRADRVNEAQDP